MMQGSVGKYIPIQQNIQDVQDSTFLHHMVNRSCLTKHNKVEPHTNSNRIEDRTMSK